jgi:4-hydroxybenzoate polyprenyltransferase
MRFLLDVFTSLRPKQWVKNLLVFAAIFLGGMLFEGEAFERVAWTFIAFCAASSAMYLLNDVVDRRRDVLHPTKQFRPIASGSVPVWLAVFLSGALIVLSLILAASLHRSLLTLVGAYIVLQFAYTLFFKRAMIIDALLISLGFILRVYAGAFVIHQPVSAWLLLAVASGAWFLALGKRRSELTLMGHRVASEHRQTLLHYPEVLLDSLTTMSATATLVFYSLYAFLTGGKMELENFAQYLPATLEAPKVLMVTIPLVVYGIARYLYIIYEKREADSPEIALLHDGPLLFDLFLLLVVLFVIIYELPKGVVFG